MSGLKGVGFRTRDSDQGLGTHPPCRISCQKTGIAAFRLKQQQPPSRDTVSTKHQCSPLFPLVLAMHLFCSAPLRMNVDSTLVLSKLA